MPGSEKKGFLRYFLGCVGFLAVVAAQLTVLSACARSAAEDAADGETVHLTLAATGNRRNQETFRRIVREFEADNPGVEVTIRFIHGDYYQKVLVMMAGNIAPDLMWMGQSFGEFAQKGAFLDVNDYIERDIDVENFFPEAVAWYRFGDRQFGLPYGIDMGYIVYNRAIFDENDVPYPRDDWTFDEFLDAARKLTVRSDDGSIERYGYWGGFIPANFGARFIDEETMEPTCNTPEMIDYLKTTQRLIDEYRVSPSSEEWRSMGLQQETAFV